MMLLNVVKIRNESVRSGAIAPALDVLWRRGKPCLLGVPALSCPRQQGRRTGRRLMESSRTGSATPVRTTESHGSIALANWFVAGT